MKAFIGRDLRSVARVKQLITLTAMLSMLGMGLFVLRHSAGAVLRSSEGADPRTAFRRSLTAPVEIRNTITWLPDRAYQGRTMEPLTRDAITDAYAQAWSAMNRAAQGDPDAPVGEYLASSALEHARRQLANHAIRSTRVRTTHVSHALELTFYSDDGSVVSLNAPEVVLERVVQQSLPDAKPVATVVGTTSTSTTTIPSASGDEPFIVDVTESVVRTKESYRLVMLLRDGNWRVELIERVGAGIPERATLWSVPTTRLAPEREGARVPSSTLHRQPNQSTTTTTTRLNSARREWRR